MWTNNWMREFVTWWMGFWKFWSRGLVKREGKCVLWRLAQSLVVVRDCLKIWVQSLNLVG